MYARSMETIYLSLRVQVAVGTFFMKSPVPGGTVLITLPFLVVIGKLHWTDLPAYLAGQYLGAGIGAAIILLNFRFIP